MAWIPPELDTDPDAVAVRILDGLAARLPGWEPYPGAPEVALAEEMGREISILAELAVASIATAVAGIGETVFGVAALQAEPAQLQVQLTLTEAATLGPEFVVVGTTGAGIDTAFSLTELTGYPAGVSTATFTAVIAGADGNGVPIGYLTIATASATVNDATATTASAGGRDDETLDAYLDRLTSTLATLRLGGVRADDLAVLARSVDGVHRAAAVDLYDPSDPDTPAERTATVFPIDAAGQPVAAGVKADLQEYLEQLREVNFIIHVEDPTYAAITITYTAVADSGSIPAGVKTEIDVALARHLSPANWGATDQDPQAWIQKPVVRYNDIIRLIGNVPGVAYVGSVTINGGTANVVLDPDGAAALPAAALTITGTVT